MAYLSNIPQASDYQDASQPQLLENFTQLNTIFGIDHVTFNAASNNGKHNKCTLTDQTAAVPVFAGTDTGIYSANDVASGTGRRELWFSSPQIGAPTYAITAGLRSTNGWARIGGGVYLIWGSQTSDANTTTDTIINLSFCPAAGTILQVSLTEFPTSVSGTDNNYVVQLTNTAGPTIGVFTRATASATRLASKRFSYIITRL